MLTNGTGNVAPEAKLGETVSTRELEPSGEPTVQSTEPNALNDGKVDQTDAIRNQGEESWMYPYVKEWLRKNGWTPVNKSGKGIKMQISDDFSCYPDITAVRTTRDRVLEIVSTEVKVSLLRWTHGLGQAALYQEFANYSYLVLPKRTRTPDRGSEKLLPRERVLPIFKRLGVGLLVFEYENPSAIEEWVPPVRQSPNLIPQRPEWLEAHIPHPKPGEKPLKRKSSVHGKVGRVHPLREIGPPRDGIDLSRLVGLLTQSGPNINDIAKHLGLFKETVRYWYKRHLLARGFTLTGVPNYRKLGLVRFISVAHFSPSFQSQAKAILATLHESCYVLGFEQTAVEGWFIIHAAVPNEHTNSFVEIFEELRKVGVFSHLEMYNFGSVRTPRMMHEYFDFESGSWTYNWSSTKEEIQLIHPGEEEREQYDKVDLLILNQLQEDSGRNLTQISRRFGMRYRGLVWHYSEHVLGRRLIESYVMNWTGIEYIHKKQEFRGSREFLPICLILTKAAEETRQSLVTFLQRLPFLWFEASGDDYFASLYLPPEILNEFFSRLRGLNIDAQALRYFIMNRSKAQNFAISHHLFDGKSKTWQLDRAHVMEKFQNLLLCARNCEHQITRS